MHNFVSSWFFISISLLPFCNVNESFANNHYKSEIGTLADDSMDTGDIIAYPNNFFERYKPQTALDMVRQVPGFQLDDKTNQTRGFAAVAGNLLINDRRPSAKQDLPSTILSRIPAGTVDKIELIRAQVRGIDLRGQSVMVNIILKDDAPAAMRWEAFVRKSFEHGPLTPFISLSLSDRWSDIEYNAGLTARKTAFGRYGTNNIFDGEGNLTEIRNDSRENRIPFINTNLGGSMNIGSTLVHMSTSFTIDRPDQFLESNRIPQAVGTEPRYEAFENNFDRIKLEIGFDVERKIINNFIGKAILLFFYQDENSLQSNQIVNSAGIQSSLRKADKDAITDEIIGRFEFDWTGLANHQIQLNAELAVNNLDGSLLQTLNTGTGPKIIPIPGSNSNVEETRWDLLINDTWSIGNFELNYGIGTEISTISQTGDAEQQRSFSYIKPQTSINHSSNNGYQTRFRVAREVSQLNLNDFISAAVLQDNDLALGNPDLQPDTTWITEISHERRFSNIGALKISLFHHWISNVVDLLPIAPSFEASGNIGSGKRYGIELESTIPLNLLGLEGARLDMKVRLQDSSVVDPITESNRQFSSIGGHGLIFFDADNTYAYDVKFRQDLESLRVAWGINILDTSDRPLFKANELDIYNEGISVGIFVETTRWFNIKMRLSLENSTDFTEVRERTVYTTERDLSPVAFQEKLDRTRGPHMIFTLSGNF